jgi:DNA-binding LytR/AlgR family response regulator
VADCEWRAGKKERQGGTSDMFGKSELQADLLPQIEGILAKRSRIAIKARGRILFVDPTEIVSVQAKGNYVLVRRNGGTELLRESMATVAEKLRSYGFVRIHRSIIINTLFVEEIVNLSSGDNIVRVKGGLEFPVSRTYKENLHSMTPLWIGTNGFRAEQRTSMAR